MISSLNANSGSVDLSKAQQFDYSADLQEAVKRLQQEMATVQKQTYENNQNITRLQSDHALTHK